MRFRAWPSSTKHHQSAFINEVCTVYQQVLDFMSTPPNCVQQDCCGSPLSNPQSFQWECSACCAVLLGPPLESAMLGIVESSGCPKHPVSSQNAHPRTVMALATCGHWNRDSFPAHQGTSGASSLCRGSGIKGYGFSPLQQTPCPYPCQYLALPVVSVIVPR